MPDVQKYMQLYTTVHYILYALPVLISLNRVRILIWSFWNGDRYTSSGTELVNAVKP